MKKLILVILIFCCVNWAFSQEYHNKVDYLIENGFVEDNIISQNRIDTNLFSELFMQEKVKNINSGFMKDGILYHFHFINSPHEFPNLSVMAIIRDEQNKVHRFIKINYEGEWGEELVWFDFNADGIEDDDEFIYAWTGIERSTEECE